MINLDKYFNNNILHAYLIGNCNYLIIKDELNKIVLKYFLNNEFEFDINLNPDVYILNTNKDLNKSLLKETLKKINVTSQISKNKILIIDNSELLSPAIYNSLLKTIEEPNNLIIFLISNNINSVSETLKSRCQIININIDTLEDYDNKVYDIANEFILALEENDYDMIAINNDIYDKINDRKVFFEVIESIQHVYLKKIKELINKKNFEINTYVDRILIINKILNKKNINYNKDLLIDEFIYLMGGHDENSICNI